MGGGLGATSLGATLKFDDMIIRFFLLTQFTLFILITGCATTSNQELKLSQLCEAFEQDSLALINDFFDKWSTEIKPISLAEKTKLSDTLRIVYQVFEDFIHSNLFENHNTYSNTKYCLLQNQIQYKISGEKHLTNPIIDSDIIYSKFEMDFRPTINEMNNNFLYVNFFYDSILNSFVTSKCGLSSNSKYSGNPWNGWPHANFLSKFFKLNASLSGFHFHSLPEINSLVFNKYLDEVVITSCFGSKWKKELFTFTKEGWEFKESFSVLRE